MPPQLALILALGFIAYAYIRESKRRGEASAAVWIATLWMMRCGSRGIEAWTGGGISEDGGANIDQLFIFIVAALGFVVVARRWSTVKTVLHRNMPVLVFFGYITLSLAWSQSLFDSSKQLFRAFGDLSMVSTDSHGIPSSGGDVDDASSRPAAADPTIGRIREVLRGAWPYA